MKRDFILFLACWLFSTVMYGQVVFTESFDATTTPTGWTNTAVTGGPWVFSTSPGWGVANTPDHTGNGGNYAWMDFSGTDVTVTLTSPAIDVSSLTTPYLEFAYESYVAAQPYPGAYNLLQIDAWDGTNWVNVDNLQGNTPQGWEIKGISLANATYSNGDSVRVRFVAESDGTSRDYENDLLIDDVTIREAVSCVAPTLLAATNVTSTSADFTWSQVGGGVAAWEVSYGAPNTPPGAGMTATVVTNSYSAPNLAPSSPYVFFVRAICAPGDTSPWAGPRGFMTTCPVYTPAYTTNFATFLPACWEEADNGTPATGPTNLGAGTWAGSGSSARINLWTTGRSDWLLSPEFDLSTPGPWELVINANATDFGSSTTFGGMGGDDSVQVVISTDGGATWRAIYTWDLNNQPSLNASNTIIDISSFTGTSNLFGIWASEGDTSGTEDYYMYINNFEIRIPPSCDAPTNLMTSNITATSADFSWMYSGGALAPTWEVTYGAPGAPAGSGISALATGTTYSAANLMSNTPYEYYVRTICAPGDTSPWAGPFAFSTPCAAFTPAYFTDFATFLPTCWEEADNGTPATGPTNLGAGTWSGSGSSARINLWTTGRSDWLLSPEFDLSTPGPWELVINANATDFSPSTAFNGMGSDDTVQVVISTDGGATWRALYTWDVNNPPAFNAGDLVIDISSFTGASNLFGIWASEGAVDDAEDYYMYINDFEIRMPPSCSAPTGLMASNITATSADFSWMYSGGALTPTWEVTYGAPGAPAGSGISALATGTTYSAANLMGNTPYEYYVRTICAPGDTSPWAGPFAFSTPCAVYTPAYFTDFATFMPTCWEQAGNGTPATGPTGLGSSSWFQSGTAARTNLFTTGKAEWLLSPEFDLSTPGPWELVINANATDFSPSTAFNGMGSDDTVQVVVSTDSGATWTPIYTWDVNNLPNLAATDEIIDISAYTGASNLFGIWASEGAVNDAEDYYMYINSFEIRMASTPAQQYGDLVITEIMYNPPESGTDSLEFVEIQNTGLTTIDLNNVSFANGVTYTFPSSLLAPGAFYVVAVNAAAFNNVYGVTADGVFTGGLGNGGELLRLVDPMGNTIDSVDYDDAGVWPSGFTQGGPDGGGASIELCDASTDNADGANWLASSTPVGVTVNGFNVLATPGAANNCTPPVDVAVTTLLVNDVYCNVSAISGSFVVTNNSSVAVNGVTYTVTLDQLVIGTGTIPSLGANASDTIAVGPVPVTVGSGVVEVTINATGDANPSNDVMSKTVFVSNIDASIATTATINCSGDSSGALMANTADAYGMSMYLWNTGDMTAAISNLAAGTYMVTATDSIGCSDTAMVTLTEPLPMVITGSVTDVTCNGFSDGSVMIAVAGGTAPYTYLWSNGATGVDLLNVPAGTYTVTVTDANGCMTMQSYTVNEPAAITTTVTHNNLDSATVVATGGVGAFTYNWSNGATTATVGGLMNNTTYMVTVADANGCTVVDSVNIAFINVATINGVNNLSMFPNPTADQVFVDLDLATAAPVQIHITNALGQLVNTQALGTIQTTRVELSTKDLPDGLYLVQFQIGEEQVTRKLIVSRQ